MGSNPWSRRADEPAQAYEAFKIYLYQPLPRSRREAWEVYSANDADAPPNAPHKSAFNRWYAQHQWEQRADAYDVWQDRRVAEQLALTRVAAQGKRLEAATALLDVGLEGLAMLKERIERARLDPDYLLQIPLKDMVLAVKQGMEALRVEFERPQPTEVRHLHAHTVLQQVQRTNLEVLDSHTLLDVFKALDDGDKVAGIIDAEVEEVPERVAKSDLTNLAAREQR